VLTYPFQTKYGYRQVNFRRSKQCLGSISDEVNNVSPGEELKMSVFAKDLPIDSDRPLCYDRGSHMFISEDQASERLDDPKNLFRAGKGPVVPAPIVPPEPPAKQEPPKLKQDALAELDRIIATGSAPKRRNLHNSERIAIAENSLILGNSAATQIGGVVSSQGYAYSNGHHTPGDVAPNRNPDEVLRERVQHAKTIISFKASNRLKNVLNLMTEEKLGKVESVSELSRVGKDMASIMEKMEPKDKTLPESLHLHLYRPEQKTLSSYDKVHVGAIIDSETGKVIEADSKDL
jgi:hypothetical protein